MCRFCCWTRTARCAATATSTSTTIRWPLTEACSFSARRQQRTVVRTGSASTSAPCRPRSTESSSPRADTAKPASASWRGQATRPAPRRGAGGPPCRDPRRRRQPRPTRNPGAPAPRTGGPAPQEQRQDHRLPSVPAQEHGKWPRQRRIRLHPQRRRCRAPLLHHRRRPPGHPDATPDAAPVTLHERMTPGHRRQQHRLCPPRDRPLAQALTHLASARGHSHRRHDTRHRPVIQPKAALFAAEEATADPVRERGAAMEE